MNSKTLLLAALLAVLVINEGSALAGDPRSLVMTDVNGKTVDFGAHLGKDVLVISFWATYCKPCKTEMPFLQDLHQRLGPKGVKVIGISLDTPDTEALVLPLLQNNGYTYSVVIDRQSEAVDLLNPKSSMPFLLVFDRSGEAAFTKDGFSPSDRDAIEAEILELLARENPIEQVPETRCSEDEGPSDFFPALEVTNSTYFDWHRTNNNRMETDDDYLDARNRLNMRLAARRYILGARLDVAWFFPMRSGDDLTAFREQYRNDLNVEKIYLKLKSRETAVELGDFNVCLGKGIAACIQKIDELGLDTTLRGAKAVYRTRYLGATAFSGWSNIVNVADMTERYLEDPEDLLSGGEVSLTLIPEVTLGIHGSYLSDNLDWEGLAGVGTRVRSSAHVLGASARASLLGGSLSLLTEFDRTGYTQVYTAAATSKYLVEHPEESDSGFAWYSSASWTWKLLTLLGELKWYEGLGAGGLTKVVADPSGGVETIFYHNLPPLEEEGLFLRPSYYDVLGFRLRADTRITDQLTLFAAGAWFDDMLDDSTRESRVRHGYGGCEVKLKDLGLSAKASGGYRLDKESADASHDYRMWHAEAELTVPVWGIHSLSVNGRSETYQDRAVLSPEEQDFAIRQATLTWSLGSALAVSGLWEYSDQPPLYDEDYHHLAGQVTWRFIEGSYFKLFAGSTRGGLKCSGGVCRVFPAFDGIRGEVTLRF